MKLIDIRMLSIKEERLIVRRYILEGTYGFNFFFSRNTIELGNYENEEEALKELDEIEDFLQKILMEFIGCQHMQIQIKLNKYESIKLIYLKSSSMY